MLSVLLNRFLSALLIRLWKEMSQLHQWCCFYHLYSYGEVHIWLQNKLSHSQSLWWVPFPTFIQCNCVITSVDNHVSKDDNMRLSFKCSIVPQSVLVVCIFSPFIRVSSSIASHASKDDDMKVSFRYIFVSPLLTGFTRAWTILEWHCPQYDLNVLVHWLSFFEHHCLQFTDSSFNHLSLPHSWSEYCLFFLLWVHCIAPICSTFQEVSRTSMSFLSRISQTQSMFFYIQ